MSVTIDEGPPTAGHSQIGSRLLLALAAIAYGGGGVLSLILPGADTAMAVAARAAGGLMIGCGLLIGWCAGSAARARQGLVVVVVLTTPMLVGRIAGLLVGGAPSFANFVHAIVEIGLLALVVGVLTLPAHVVRRNGARR